MPGRIPLSRIRHALPVAVAFALAPLASTSPALAQTSTSDGAAEARELFETARRALDAGHYVEAALGFEAAAALRPHGAPLLAAAHAWDEANQPARAADAYRRALALQGLSATHEALARDRVDALERTLGTLRVTGPDGTRVELDGATSVTVPAYVHGAAGTHTLTVTSPGREPSPRLVTLYAGQITKLEASPSPVVGGAVASRHGPSRTEPARAAGETSLAPAEPGGSKKTRRIIGFSIAGLGVATVGAAAVLGTQALEARDKYNESPTVEAYDHASKLETLTNVAFGAGAGLALTGTILALWPSGGAAPSRDAVFVFLPTPTSARVRWTF